MFRLNLRKKLNCDENYLKYKEKYTHLLLSREKKNALKNSQKE
jgi:hypothetical protein